MIIHTLVFEVSQYMPCWEEATKNGEWPPQRAGGPGIRVRSSSHPASDTQEGTGSIRFVSVP